jgi:dTDP-4-amino-4,6-dideoxygalactose transaminase
MHDVPGHDYDIVPKSQQSSKWESCERLASDGGKAIRSAPFAPWPHFEADEIEAAVRVLRSGAINYWTGEEGRRFEEEFAHHAGCAYGVAVANGTVALELALHALGIGVGDEVIVPSRTFMASASCAIMRGAKVVVADVDRHSQNLTLDTILPLITPHTKAIIAVHLAGWPCEMDSILELSHSYGLKVIEDCAQAHGAIYNGRPIGSFGDVAAFSFCQDKIMTTGGEGGMLTTNDRSIWERAWSFKDHGKSYDAVYNRSHPPGFRWLHESFGTNWRLTEMQSAMGRVLLGKLRGCVETRRKHADILSSSFLSIPGLRVTEPPERSGHSYYKYYAFVRPEKLRDGWTRDRIMSAINAEGIPCSVGSCSEIYLERAFPEDMRPSKTLDVARELGETSLMFLVHPTLSDNDMLDTCQAVGKVFTVAAAPDRAASIAELSALPRQKAFGHVTGR